MTGTLLIGTAGWSIPSHHAAGFPETGSHLERYAARLPAVEINSSFYKPHRRTTYQRWAEAVPSAFRFSVKLPKQMSHERRLVDCGAPLQAFAEQVDGLGPKLGALLVQLPPSLAFDASIAASFFRALPAAISAPVVCEPRHASWFTAAADKLLVDLGIARVAADPARVPAAGIPGGWRGLCYLRLHGSPELYRSAYGEDRLRAYAAMLQTLPRDRPPWCIFDNTARMAATGDALTFRSMLQA